MLFRKFEIQDLKCKKILGEIDIKDLRRSAEILIIDDQKPDEIISALEAHKFTVSYKQDIDNINDVTAYDIILCDIRGVGKEFHSNQEGAYLIKEIKSIYPNKIVIAYTASNYDASYNEYLKLADDVLVKSSLMDISRWVSVLDIHIKSSLDPIDQWSKIRYKLLEGDIRISVVARIENEYVKAINKKNFQSFEKLVEVLEPNDETKRFIKSFLTSLLVKIISGGIIKWT